MLGYLTDVKGIQVGHAQDYEAGTGCTVILCSEGAVAGVDVRGGAPGTRETDLMAPENLVQKVHAVYLSGGSAFGLDGASGAVHYLEKKGIGFDVGVTKVPIVPAAVIFDLTVGDFRKRPDFNMGYEACLNAKAKNDVLGNIGAGTGATVGKYFGDEFSMKGGLGTASIKIGELVVAALVVVNCLGDVTDYDTGNILAGALNKTKTGFANTIESIKNELKSKNFFGRNTTLGVVATNASLSKAGAKKAASMAHDGFARTIRPVHTMFDGDTIFCLSLGNIEADVSTIGILAAEAVAKAVVCAVKSAEPMYGRKAYKSFLD
ncbi:P1 family peptidase [Tepidanaerobacter acetatoxydans]|uniref:P1 family peptidase n=1 Tax=Tepidanaerobacter acetatoxydans TaxID=499229 RepID=UPI001BD66575|nr:P1 family peptidase [Tepidanaerobacter acetatoxydans]